MDNPFSDVRRWFSHLLHNDPFLTAMSLSTCTEKVSIQAQQGQLVAVTGPHGSGKATLLRLLGHVVFPQEGSIFIPSHLRAPWQMGGWGPYSYPLLWTQEIHLIARNELVKRCKKHRNDRFVLGFITLVVAWEWFWRLRCCMWRRKLWCWIPAHGKTCCSDVPDTSLVDANRVRLILDMMEMKGTLSLIEEDLLRHAKGAEGEESPKNSNTYEESGQQDLGKLRQTPRTIPVSNPWPAGLLANSHDVQGPNHEWQLSFLRGCPHRLISPDLLAAS